MLVGDVIILLDEIGVGDGACGYGPEEICIGGRLKFEFIAFSVFIMVIYKERNLINSSKIC